VRAERLGLMRILLALALLTDQLFQYLPHLEEFFGPHGVAAEGLYDAYQLRAWRWTVYFFYTDQMSILYPIFSVWVVCTLAFLLGWQTRLMSVAVWFLTLCFINRNPNILNGGDDTLQVGLFLLMLSPCGRALSLDAWRQRRRHPQSQDPVLVPAWSVRVLQIQLCVIYLTTGLAKVQGDDWFSGTWWDGTSIHYVLNYVTMSRWSYAQLPVPLWITAPMTYISAWWEVLFTLLVLSRRTRPWALWFGVLFHLGIYFTIEVGWFSFYTLAFYGVWVPCTFWQKWTKRA
jgi:uncharacterized membrane protein YphA (DoxX/SURF4 family)